MQRNTGRDGSELRYILSPINFHQLGGPETVGCFHLLVNDFAMRLERGRACVLKLRKYSQGSSIFSIVSKRTNSQAIQMINAAVLSNGLIL